MVVRMLVCCVCVMSATAPLGAQQPYPTVYGATGHPYGPTQAAYQHERQYGQPWHGYGGQTDTGPRYHSYTLGGYPFASGWRYPGALGPGVVAPLVSPAPGLTYWIPGGYGAFGLYGRSGYTLPYPAYGIAQQPPTAPLTDASQFNGNRWSDALLSGKPDPTTRPALPSSAEAKLRSRRAQIQGDEHMRKQAWQHAYVDYKRAVGYADDLAEAHLRLGFALLTVHHYDTAAAAFKRALHLDPSLPQSGFTLESLYGPDSDLTRASIISRVTEDVEKDVGNPDRLFLLGLLLHFNQDSRGREFIEQAYRLVGKGKHLTAFLQQPVAQQASPKPSVPKPAVWPVMPGPRMAPPAPKPMPPDAEPSGLPPAPAPTGIPTQSRLTQPPVEGPVLLPPT